MESASEPCFWSATTGDERPALAKCSRGVEDYAALGVRESGLSGFELDELFEQGGLGAEADGSGEVGRLGGRVVRIDQVENMDGRAQALGRPGGVIVNARRVGGAIDADENVGHGMTRRGGAS